MILAIDPGSTGCLALLSERGGYLEHLHMPTIKVGSKTRVNGAAIKGWLDDECRIKAGWITHAFIEQVQAMPGQGVSSMFTFGHAAGLVEGVITGAGIPLTLVTPQAWKKHAGLIGSDKDAARSRAVQLFPGVRDLDKKAKGQALADAMLIGLYGIAKGDL